MPPFASARDSNRGLKTRTLDLIEQYRQDPSTDLRNRLVELNLGLVRREAYHWSGQCQESYEELLQIGSLGLIRAIERFDPKKGAAFSTFALPYIRGEIQHYLRDRSSSIRVPRRWFTLQQQAASVIHTLRDDLGRQPTDHELAAALEISLEEWQQVKLANSNRSPLSLDAPVGCEGEDTASLGEMVPDRRYHSFQLAEEDRIRLQDALVHLEHRTREILEFVFLYDLTQKEVADRLGISSVTVSRRVKKGLDSLKSLMMGADD
jgi:RNA polymerase sigma-B factor